MVISRSLSKYLKDDCRRQRYGQYRQPPSGHPPEDVDHHSDRLGREGRPYHPSYGYRYAGKMAQQSQAAAHLFAAVRMPLSEHNLSAGCRHSTPGQRPVVDGRSNTDRARATSQASAAVQATSGITPDPSHFEPVTVSITVPPGPRAAARRTEHRRQRPIQTSHPLDCLGGRRPGPAPAQVALTPQLYDAGEHTVQQIVDWACRARRCTGAWTRPASESVPLLRPTRQQRRWFRSGVLNEERCAALRCVHR
jgi:hypothetical protein